MGTKKNEILAKTTLLGIFGQILPKTPIVSRAAKEHNVQERENSGHTDGRNDRMDGQTDMQFKIEF